MQNPNVHAEIGVYFPRSNIAVILDAIRAVTAVDVMGTSGGKCNIAIICSLPLRHSVHRRYDSVCLYICVSALSHSHLCSLHRCLSNISPGTSEGNHFAAVRRYVYARFHTTYIIANQC